MNINETTGIIFKVLFNQYNLPDWRSLFVRGNHAN